MVTKAEIERMAKQTLDSAVISNKDVWDITFISRYMSDAFFANTDIYTRKAFRYYVVFSLIDVGYLKNLNLFSMSTFGGFNYLIEIVDKYFDIFVSEQQFSYIRKGKLNIYDGSELTNISSIFCDMFEELMFGGLGGNNLSDLNGDIKFVLRLKVRSMTILLNGLFDSYNLSILYDFILNTIKKFGGKYLNFPEFMIKSKDKPEVILNLDRDDEKLIHDIHYVCKPITESASLSEPIVRIAETNEDWITKIEIGEEPLLVVNKNKFIKCRYTYELFYDFAKSIVIIDSLKDINYVKSSIFHGYEDLREIEDAIDFCTEPIPYLFCKNMFGVDIYNNTMSKEKLDSFIDVVMKENQCNEIFEELKSALLMHSWENNLVHLPNYKFNKKCSFKSLYNLEEWIKSNKKFNK